MSRTVILVPRRDGQQDRDILWTWVRNWWQEKQPTYEIFEGPHDDGLFNRSAAINRAAALADWQLAAGKGPWDVAIIIDSDVICDPGKVRDAVQIAQETGRMVMPFNVRHDLNAQGSDRVRSGNTGSWTSYIRKTYNNMVSGVVVVTRQLWNDVGGFDEGFVGWGFEDNAFAAACRTFSGADEIKLPGELWHLYHATAPEGKRGTETHRRNKRRADLYLLARGDKERTRELRNTAPPAFEHRPTGIPRILHRTIPAKIDDAVEARWKKFAELHPHWELMTHRDPLPPAQWPETSHKWGECSHGAQLAGLVRLEALWRHGGIYVDADVIPIRSLEPLLPLSAFAAWEDARTVPDAVIGAVPGHPAIRKCIDLALERLAGGPWQSGPGVTTEVFSGRDDVLLLPPGSFYSVHYGTGRTPERDATMRAAELMPNPWSFGLHLYEHSWKPTTE